MSKQKEKLFLIDAMAMIYKSYFAMISNPLINSKGKNTSAIYGFVNSLIKIMDDEKPDHIAVCFDTEKPTFRHEKYPKYKAQRQEIPTDMPWQIDKVKEIVKAMNVPLIELEGFEADDIIGTLVKRAEKEDVLSYMVTPDKDYYQLVSDKTFVYKPVRSVYGSRVAESEIIDIPKVIEKFGVPPERVVDILGLMGDSADNIPGVKGIGEKTAKELITEFGSIEGIYENIEKITKLKRKESLVLQKDDAFLAKYLVTIDVNVPLTINFHSLRVTKYNFPEVKRLLEEVEFKALLTKITKVYQEEGIPAETPEEPKPKPIISGDDVELSISGEKLESLKVEIPKVEKKLLTVKTKPHKYYPVTTKDDYLRLMKKLSGEKLISFDTETTDVDPFTAQLVGMSFAYNEDEAFYVPVKINLDEAGTGGGLFESEVHEEKSAKNEEKIPVNFAITHLKPVLESRDIRKVGHNIKFDYLMMRNYGIEMQNIFFDSMIGGFILNQDQQYNMDAMSEKYLNYEPVHIEELIGKRGKGQISMADVDIDKITEYAAEDADVTLQLYYKIKYELQKIDLYKLCTDVEFPLIKVLAEMEFAGVKVDAKILKAIDKEIVKLIAEYENKIYELAGEKFNINSTAQLARILFDVLKLEPVKKTKTGFSTDSSVLEEIKSQHQIAEILINYRMLTKIKSTYVEGLDKSINKKTGRVHTSYNQIGASTGRLSSVNPNLQNIPVRTDIGRTLRKAFVTESDDFVMLSADYSQIELRIMAHYCKDENMINAFKKNQDIHSDTAKRIFSVEHKKDITPNMRRKAKEVNFGIIYGIGAFGLARRLEIRNTEAKDIIDRYFNEYPKVKEYMEYTKKFARENGFVQTITGRRRYLSQINNQNASARAEDERAAINMPIQGTAADMIKIAMNNIYEEFLKNKLESKMLLQVHDELVFEVKKSELEQVKNIVLNEMKNAIKLDVPIEVEIGVGKNWFEAH
jgi:DNA polymerase-1